MITISSHLELFLRIIMAFVLGGLIGMERESMNRPAGFRTHILVCVGAALVMYTNILLTEQYRGIIPVDPTRIGAQVISGIGFLGAGTIIKEGVSIKGLTTAASLWTVGCLGLAIGSGFYELSLYTTVLILIVLQTFGWLESKAIKLKRDVIFYIEINNTAGQINRLNAVMDEMGCRLTNVAVSNISDDKSSIKVYIKHPKGINTFAIVDRINQIPGILSIEQVNS